MGKAYPSDLRWRAVFSIWWHELYFPAVALKLSSGPMVVSAKWVASVWRLFCETGDVETVQGKRDILACCHP